MRTSGRRVNEGGDESGVRGRRALASAEELDAPGALSALVSVDGALATSEEAPPAGTAANPFAEGAACLRVLSRCSSLCTLSSSAPQPACASSN